MAQRTEHAVQVDVHKDYQEQPSRIIPTVVPVHIGHQVRTVLDAAEFGVYTTFVIPCGLAGAVMILPEDPERVRAVLQNRASIILLANTQSAAQAPGNIAATTGTPPPTPAGFLLNGSESLEVKNHSMVWAVNTDPTNAAYVSVMVERNNP